MPYDRELAVAIDVLHHTSRLSLAVLSSTNKAIHSKDDHSPVTVADFAIQAVLSATFSHHFPADHLVGEEDSSALRADPSLLARVVAELAALAAALPAAALTRIPTDPHDICRFIDLCAAGSPAARSRTWVFDPIDGTQAFISHGLFAINIGLVANAAQLLGAVACPNLDPAAAVRGPISNSSTSTSGCIFTATAGGGAFVRPLDPHDPAPPRRLAKTSAATDPVVLVGCSTMPKSAHDALHRAVATRLDAEFPGSDLISWVVRYCALALGAGNAAVWVYLKDERRSKIWDHAGAQLVFIEAGGTVTDTRGRPMDFAAGRLMSENYGILAADAGVYEKVKTELHQVMREFGRKELE
ncbi:hypothetical protein TD95_001646 [Thielaviopsis punctulata]|uniref:3'(2'),5'-bisphosphate nucleotidase n=1 Tax=Thielaviopsis punctulata TaxID=72032 RepID=A0A0F4Z982_9PEZI|nr:hypothetical protein TD95_001646 [Thielaviopsis punctulata]